MEIVKLLRMHPYEFTRRAADAIEALRHEAYTWSKACEAATTKLHKLRMHPRLEVRYWTDERWEPLCGPSFDAVLDCLDPAPVSGIEHAAQITAEEHDALIQDAFRYRWLRRNSGYTIRCNLFGEVPMHEHKDADLDAAIDAAMEVTPNALADGPERR